MGDMLTDEEKKILLDLARRALRRAAAGQGLEPLDRRGLPSALREEGASFVTLTIEGELRGCIGALAPYQPLAEDVREHTVAAAREDPRFPPVSPEEVDRIEIEVSRLTFPRPLEYDDTQDLLRRLRPHRDGVILQDGQLRATFLPQVWDKLPDKAEVLEKLCSKTGVAPDTWRRRRLTVMTYEVEEFSEARPQPG